MKNNFYRGMGIFKLGVILIILAFPLCTKAGNNRDSTKIEWAKVERIRHTNQVWMFGVGSANLYDTYLSPIEYKGTSFRIYNERMRGTTWFDYKFKKQQIYGIEFATTDNLVKNASRYRLVADYRLGGHYEFYNQGDLKIGAGLIWSINGGVEFNERNGNNPASAKLYTNINASLIASYKLPWFAVRWQLDSPFAGILFSPRFGQSYYEISIGNSVDIVNFASLHNQRALRNYLTIDIPINKYSIRLGYLGDYYQTKVNSIQTHAYMHSFVIGMPLEGVVKTKKKANNAYWGN